MNPSDLTICYRDDYLVAIDKPTGLLVHPTQIDRYAGDSVERRLKRQLGRRVYVVHRLDKGTSGILLLALDPNTARCCTEIFRRREVDKTYLAIVRGFTDSEGVIDHPLADVDDDTTGTGSTSDRVKKAARTVYRRLATAQLPIAISRYPTARYSLVTVQPESGRMHQIRRHFKQIRNPVIGDGRYGDHRHNRHFREVWHCNRLLLAATRLHLTHPIDGASLNLTAPLDENFSTILRRLGWEAQITDH
jgi:tRNA pseudouridine65 synthase